MATLLTHIATRHHTHNNTVAPSQTTLRRSSAAKRPCSPEPGYESSAKRVKTSDREEIRREKEKRRSEREHEFRVKYTRAFPGWVFYFDIDPLSPELQSLRSNLERRVHAMNGRIDDFFSKEITHLIILQHDDNKENRPRSHQVKSALGSPIRLKGRTNDTLAKHPGHLVKKALGFGMKVWSASKLDSILDRCHAPPATTMMPHHAPAASKERSLSRLLESERLHGTAERDPTQRRHDYTYFSKNSYYVLVEDMRGELATIAAQEYPVVKGKEKAAWPVLHCHPLSRGPFVEYDEKEQRRRARADQLDRERERERERQQRIKRDKLREQERQRRVKAQQQAKQHDLRRTVSMQNLQRRSTYPNASIEGLVDLDADFGDDSTIGSANASGYLASGAYMAASGNSVGVTSTTGTSTVSSVFRTLQLPTVLKDRLNQQVVTSRKFSAVNVTEGKENRMGPPSHVPERVTMLRKSRSTNTIRLPKREEGIKPGYCESCRAKFEDFQEHIIGRKHRKFAMNDANWVHLDSVLARVKRRTKGEVRAADDMDWNSSPRHSDEVSPDEHDMALRWPSQDSDSNDVSWGDWVHADGM